MGVRPLAGNRLFLGVVDLLKYKGRKVPCKRGDDALCLWNVIEVRSNGICTTWSYGCSMDIRNGCNKR